LIDIFNLINPEIINYGILRYENKPKKRANNSTFGINVPFIPGSFRVSEQLTADLTQWKKGEPNNKDVELYKITKHSNAILITNDNDLKDACKQNRIICKNIVDLEHLDTFAPIDVLDYIYGVLHSPSYREKYKEFLKIDFPRVPYPKNAKSFFAIGKIGSDLCQLHLMEHPALGKLITKYPVNGDNVVDKPRFEDGKVYINAEQYFEGVPAEVWNFYIGGYQVAHKWLKDRKGRELSFDDILHYQKIIVSLSETIRLMKEVDKIIDMK
jgi:predicted helicase